MSSAGCDVVLVEPEPGVARAFVLALERRGHRVRSAGGLAEALALPDPDVFVASLPDAEGFELLTEAQRLGRLARAVLVLRQAPSGRLARALELGTCEVLRRPVELPGLVRAVESAAAPRTGELRFELTADPQAVETAARQLLALAIQSGVGPTARARMASATADIVDNAVRHAYQGGGGAIEVAARICEREAAVRVRDRGRGFAVRDPQRRSPDGRDLGGLDRARALSEGLELWSETDRGSTALLRFGIYRVAFGDAPLLDLTELDYLAPTTARELLRLLRRDPLRMELSLSPALAVLVGRLLSATAARAPVHALISAP